MKMKLIFSVFVILLPVVSTNKNTISDKTVFKFSVPQQLLIYKFFPDKARLSLTLNAYS